MKNKTQDTYYHQHAEELARLGVTEEMWCAMETREQRIRDLVGRGVTHRHATEIVHGVDLSDNPAWS